MAKQSLQDLITSLQQNPQDPKILKELGDALFELKDFEKAQSCYAEACKITPTDPQVYLCLATVHMALREFDEAVTVYQKVLQLDAQSYAAHVGMASVCERRLQDSEALEWAQKACVLSPHAPEACVVLSTVLRRQKKHEQALEVIEGVFAKHPQNVLVLFEKARVLEACGDFKEAFSFFTKANHQSDKHVQTKEQFLQQCEQLTEVYHKIQNSVGFAKQTVSHDTPVYIVGCLRSGSTLLAEMLGAHSDFAHAGELDHVPSLVAPKDLPQTLEALYLKGDEGLLQSLQHTYQQKLVSLQKGPQLIDKMLFNAFYMGLINKLVPGAPIIHVIRDGREVALSAFKQNFQDDQWHSHDVQNALCDWEHTIRLARLAATVFAMPYLEVHYEDLVKSTESTLRTVLTFLKRPWQQACLDFAHNTQDIKTASYSQVRQRVYTSSLTSQNKYPEVYEQMTAWAKAYLEELGYET